MTKAKTKSEAKPAQEASPSPKSKPMPAGMHTVTPHIICAGAAEAIEFYKKAFGATEMFRLPGPDGKLMHGSIRIGELGGDARRGEREARHLRTETSQGLPGHHPSLR